MIYPPFRNLLKQEGRMQKWEYCAIGPIKIGEGGWRGESPQKISFTSAGFEITPIQKDEAPEADNIAYEIATLGKDGWELVSCGDVGNILVGVGHIYHYLYFKRARE
jgi:hypothetical protein